ncbi:hypothetical protein V2J09_016023 [Rumex salicifolius]
MAVLMANASEVSSRENNVELEAKRRKSAQARIPRDPNIWQQMRENFETIILEDHAFAEQHEIELALWQMHYRQIEETRANFNAAMAVVGSPPGHGGKAGSARPDRVAKIRSQMKTFLSEATGFYHELMLKIKAKYGLPLGYFSDDTKNEAFLSKEGNISAELKKGLISCHRCLIYLGDLARYKGIYGEEESKLREFAAASGYYMQASFFWPSSGNPHHQLAILASYSGDEFVAVYRYFRSLAVENPFSMARDNLIIAFEKNRLNFSQLIGGAKTPASKPVPMRMNGKGRSRAEARFSGKDHKIDASLVKERVVSTANVLSMAKNDFMDLLCSQSEDVQSFGSDAAESELFIVRLVAIIIFSVHNAGRDSEDQLRAEILQQTVLLQYAYAAAYEFMGIITERCLKLQDPLSSFLLPGFLVFVEWLACRPEAPYVNEEEKLAKIRAVFWKNCVSIFNKVVSSGLLVEDDSYFLNISRCEEGETANQQSLWEDFELRGFLPLQAAQQILDFSRKRSLGVEGGQKEKRARGQRILAAAKALSSIVRVGEQFVYFDPKLKKFVIGAEPLVSFDFALKIPETTQNCRSVKDVPAEKRMDLVVLKPLQQLSVDGEDEEEEIVFKPSMADNIADARISALTPENALRTIADTPSSNLSNHIASVASAVASTPAPLGTGVAQHALPIQLNSSNWQMKKEASITMNGCKNLSLMENGHSRNMELQDQYGGIQPPPLSPPFLQPVKPGSGLQPVLKSVMPSKSQSNMTFAYALNGLPIKPASLLPVSAKRSPVSRPLRHAGPPPGFTPSLKHTPEMNVKDDEICIVDDYSWLDGYQMPSPKLTPEFNSSCNLIRQAYNDESKCTGSITGMVTFPFPGKQFSAFQVPVENPKGWQDYHFSQPLNLFQEQNQHLLQKGNQQALPQQKQFQGQSLWDGQFLV